MTTPTTLALAAILRLRGVGRKQALRMIACELADDADIEETVCKLAGIAGHSTDVGSEVFLAARVALTGGLDQGVRAFGLYDSGYPVRLKDTPDPPAILYVKGDASALNASRSVAVVGTREPTEYGSKVARKLAMRVADAGYVVVSGLAHGCDTLGHEGCLDAGGVGIAVMAHGLDKVYPAANRGLAQRLAAHGGCLVSEYPLGVTPMRNAFAERDRIQSGLSDAVLVIETDMQGGTMHTVRFARQQRRPLACISHPTKWLTEDKTKGNQQMIRDGWAVPIPDGEALLTFLHGLSSVSALSNDPKSPMGDQHELGL